MEEFYQKKLFLKKKFTFKENGIDIAFTDKDGDFSLFIKFDRISPRENVRINTKRKAIILRFGLLAAFLTLSRGFLTANTNIKTTILIVLVSLFIAGATYAYYYLTQLKYFSVGLEDNKSFMVIYNKPSVEQAKEFIDEIFVKRKAYYRNQYFHIDYENSKKSEIEKMQWLKSEDIISDNELNVVLDEINENIEN